MANKRMISSTTWTDEKFITLDDITRLVWFGIITNCDDQGRLQNNPLLIKAQLFPADRKSASLIKASIDRLADIGMITKYEKDGKSLLQINNWWTHQTPSWASASLYPAPDNWVDRVKVHAKGGAIQSLNWDQQGGYIAATLELHSRYVGDTQSIEKVNGDVKLTTTTTAQEKSEKVGEIFKSYETEIGMLTPTVRDEVLSALELYPADWLIEAFRESAKSNKRAWKYALAILKRWKVDGFKVDARPKSNNGHNSRRGKPDMGGYEISRASEIVIDDDGLEVDDDLRF